MPKEVTKKPVFLFYGPDRYSCYQKLKFWQDEFVKKYGDNSLEIIEGKKLNPQEFATNLEALPFLSEKRLIIVKDFLDDGHKDDQKIVAESIENTADFCIIVFYESEIPEKTSSLYKKIVKIGKVEEFKAMSPDTICKWIMEKAKKDNIKISFPTANYLSQYCEPELWSVSQELDKLALFANGQEITKAMIDELCVASLTSTIFKFTDSLAQKSRKQSIKNFSILCETGEDLGRIFFMIVRHFRILLQVKDLLNKGENGTSITKKLGQHPFVIQKSSSQSRNFPFEKLQEIYKKLLSIDVQVKTGGIKSHKGDQGEFELAIEKLIVDCCK